MKLDDLLESQAVSVVFIGDFNPVIINPHWLATKELILQEEADKAEVEVIHPDIVRYNLPWASIEITKNRFEVSSHKSSHFDPVIDLCLNIFKILSETPIRVLGINCLYDISLRSKDHLYQFGNIIAPLRLWENSLSSPLLNRIEIVELERKDGLPGKYRVKVYPSPAQIQNGIRFDINDHYKLPEDHRGTDLELVRRLETKWGESRKRAKNVAESIFETVYNQIRK